MRLQFAKRTGIPEDWVGVDMHVHSSASDGLPRIPKILERAKRRGIGVAITDHNTIAGAIDACERARDVLVIPGIEVSSAQNVHLLFYFEHPSDLESFYLRVVEPCKRKRLFCKSIDLPVCEIVHAAREFPSLSVLAHPFGNGKFKKCPTHEREDILSLVDGVEICNGVLGHRRNQKAYILAKLHHLLHVGGSDAHVACACGHVCTFAPGTDAPSFLHSLQNGVSTVCSYPFSALEVMEDGMVITLRYLWHALHRQRLWI